MRKLFNIQKHFTGAHLLIDSDGSYKLHDQNPLRNNLPSAKQEGNVRSRSICRNYFPIFAMHCASIFHVAIMMILLQVMICFPLTVNFIYYFSASYLLSKNIPSLLNLLKSCDRPYYQLVCHKEQRTKAISSWTWIYSFVRIYELL